MQLLRFLLALWLFAARPGFSMVFFYHIPKCSGSSVTAILSYYYSAHDIYRIYASQSICPYGEKWWKDPFYLEQLEFSTVKNFPFSAFAPNERCFVNGHLYFRDGFPYFPHAINIVFLRDPIQRLLSHQNFWKMCAEYSPEESMNQSHLIPLGPPIDVAHNLQVYYLSSFSWLDPTISLQQHLDSAKYNLLHYFDFVGITEHFDASINALCKMLGLEKISAIPVCNRLASRGNHYSEEKIEELKKINWADYELYHFAQELFEKKFRHNTTVLQQPVVHSFADRIEYTPDQAIVGNGWMIRECCPSYPYYWRTSFVKNPHLVFSLNKRDYRVRFLAKTAVERSIESLQLRVNGYLIDLKKMQQGEWYLFEGALPEKAVGKGEPTTFAFQIDELLDLDQNSGGRLLGLSLARFEIEPF